MVLEHTTRAISSAPVFLAGVEGIEPPVRVLETRGLPLTDTPLNPDRCASIVSLFRFLVQGVLPAGSAMLFELNTIFELFFVLAGKIVDVLAHGTLKLHEIVLGHTFQ